MILLIYFGVFLPVGLALRLMKRDALNLKIDRANVDVLATQETTVRGSELLPPIVVRRVPPKLRREQSGVRDRKRIK